jgi:hypothetical protein
MATKLRDDASDPRNHKYIAHQIALLYQCINMVRGESKALKRRIEEQFETIKRHTESAPGANAGEGGGGTLPPGLRAWLEDLTEEVVALVKRHPPGMTERLNPMLRALAHEAT